MSDENTTPTPEEVLQTTPNPDVIKQIMQEHASVVAAGTGLATLSARIKDAIDSMTGNNPRLALAAVNELHLMYDYVLRRALDQANTAPQASETAPETVAEAAATETQNG